MTCVTSFPITISRGWHVQLSLLWISACWIGASLFITPFITKEPKYHVRYVNTIFWMTFILVAGSIVGIYIGPMGLTKYWYWLGNQGWEYVEPGKLWQGLLFAIFVTVGDDTIQGPETCPFAKTTLGTSQLAGLYHVQYFDSFNFRVYSNTQNQFCDCRFLEMVCHSHVG